MQTLILGAIAFPIMFVLDFLWIWLTSELYHQQLGSMLREGVLWLAAIAFYLIYCLALAYFVLLPSVKLRSLHHALIAGALFGLVTYAAYNLTNLSTIMLWPIPLTVIDMIWGVITTVVTVLVTYVLATRVLKY